MTTTPRSRLDLAATRLLAAPLALGILACEDAAPRDAAAPDVGKTQAASVPRCVSPDTTPVSLAVREFITTTTPTPQRYLSAAGTDSAVPEDGFKVLQDKGPTYFYSSDPKAQAQIKEKLASVGPYASLLVVFKGKTETDNGNRATISLAGHFVGGEYDGTAVPVRSIEVRCDSTGWRLATAATAASATTPPVRPTPDSGTRP